MKSIPFIKAFYLLIVILSSFNMLLAQQNQNSKSDSLIAASQTGAMPLLFTINPQFGKFEVSDFSNEREFSIRGGLPNFITKAKSGKPLTIAYLGGSITRTDECYRLQSVAYLKNYFPNSTIQAVNAGISGTGTDLGVCRLQEQFLRYNPDLVFVEFAVNGGPNEAMEGIIRQIIKYNPQIDICLIYTITKAQTFYYPSGKYPPNIESLEKIADYYHLPSVQLGMETSFLEQQGKLVFASTTAASNKIVFSKDGVHPNRAGGDLYAAAIARAFNKMKAVDYETKNHILVNPLFKDSWEDAHWYPLTANISFTKGWKEERTDSNDNFKQFNPWFSTIMKADKPREYLTFSFTGKAFGIFDIGGPEVGQLAVEIDGKKVRLLPTWSPRISKALYTDSSETSLMNRFNVNCNNRYRGQFDMVEVEAGKHQVKLIVSNKKADKLAILGKNNADMIDNPSKYNQTNIYLGRLLIRGEW